MAILVDDAIWRWRGRSWAHLVSDSDLDELHDFAHRLGMPYLAFQGDHYDIHADLRRAAVDAGATPVSGRHIVVALREAGLRRRGGVEPWEWAWRHPVTRVVAGAPSEVGADLERGIDELASRGVPVEVGLARRRGEQLVVLSSPDATPITPGLVRAGGAITHHRSSGERGTFLEWRLPAL